MKEIPLAMQIKPHKLGAFYFTLGNLSADKRSSLQAIQLVLLVYVQDLKVYGFNKVVKPLLEDLRVLENEGVQCGPVKLRGTVIALAGDNLANHSICGFMESFSGSATSTLCRFCNGTRDMMRTNTPATQFKLRTKANYDKKVEVVSKFPDMSSMYGLKTHCVFNDLKYFHAVTGLTPDIMHDVLEVVIGYDLCLVIPRMVSEEIATLVFFPKLSNEHVAYLDALIIDHHELLLELFPTTYSPETETSPHATLCGFNPCLWSSAEGLVQAKHYYFKKLIQRVRNFKNVPSTLATKHQLWQAAHDSDSNYLQPVIDVTSSVSIDLDNLNEKVQEAIASTFENLSGEVITSNSVTCNGIQYKLKMLLALSVEHGNQIFGEIKLILHDCPYASPHFVVQCWNSLPVLSANHICKLSQMGATQIVQVADCVDYYPLSYYFSQREKLLPSSMPFFPKLIN
ncbi:hypothetical protein CAPTEDRAFT_196585 [Capitella teleta]|uniref:Uncharacterized protein n=1 Tax=Capitella teleta TaxID=283909 RepID=R7U780_CAPTE|nr:hypothetical protein CAPTEDRAFT_196585 [Capitella teleta]|eukprot:ELU01829.1 hypothetical protein CAPTEDRAFT_196585 [Capitella teleta]